MLIRVRAKAVNRKAQFEQEENARRRCQREGRIATLQLKNYWDCYPLPTVGDQLKSKQDAESSEDELIEDDGHGMASTTNTGPCVDPRAELICANAVPDRKRYLDELMKKHQGKRARS